MQHGCWVLQIRYAPRPKAKQADMKWARSTDVGYNQTWATREAATAAKAHFKAWVENSRNAQQRAASEASVIARAAAVTAAREKPPLPVRFRGGLRLESATVGVKLQVGKGAAVAVVLETVLHASETLLLRYKDRSAQVIDRAKRRRDAADAAARCIPESIWDDFFERCAKAARRAESQPSAAQPALKPRGKSRARQIGLRRQHRSSAARREQAAFTAAFSKLQTGDAEGVEAGEEVVTAGVFKLRNGAPVAVDNSQLPPVSLTPTPPNT